MQATGADLDAMYSEEIARIRGGGVLGNSGRVFDLFEFLARRGVTAPAATQAELAEFVFGQSMAMADDATVRVYIHRLRKRLDEFYAANGTGKDGVRLTLPAGSYALRLVTEEGEVEALVHDAAGRRARWRLLGLAGLAMLAGLAAGLLIPRGDAPPPANALWQPLLDSPRPVLIVLGDYYIYGEIDPVVPENGRLIRDFRVNSAADLELMQDLQPERYGMAEDFGLNYLPFSSAYGLERVVPLLARGDRRISVIAASELQPDMLNYFNVVYIGLFSGMRMLEDHTFAGSALKIGESYDELIDAARGTTYVSEEARRVASPASYRDYAYVARYRTVSGAIVVVLAGARDTGLRGIAPAMTGADLPPELDAVAGSDSYEALYQVTGQQGANLSRRLVLARERGPATAGERP
jgi:hypothetical protein